MQNQATKTTRPIVVASIAALPSVPAEEHSDAWHAGFAAGAKGAPSDPIEGFRTGYEYGSMIAAHGWPDRT
jgi:hypothetical protein